MPADSIQTLRRGGGFINPIQSIDLRFVDDSVGFCKAPASCRAFSMPASWAFMMAASFARFRTGRFRPITFLNAKCPETQSVAFAVTLLTDGEKGHGAV